MPFDEWKDTEFECCLAIALAKIPRGSETGTAIAVHYMGDIALLYPANSS